MASVYSFDKVCKPPYPLKLLGAFKDNIRVFLQNCCTCEEFEFNGMKVWNLLLVKSDKRTGVPLYVLEEETERSESPFCEHCKKAGWAVHFLTKRRYHFFVTNQHYWNQPLKSEAMLVNPLLHAVIHCNSLGHLVSLNGFEGGSTYLHGQDIMQMFDGLCTTLGTRMVTVNDLARKYTVDLRLIHGIAFGDTWFSKWGYSFHHGCFGVTEQQYKRALQHVSSLSIAALCAHENEPKFDLMVTSYQSNRSDIFTVGELLNLMLSLLSTNVRDKEFSNGHESSIAGKDFTDMLLGAVSRVDILSDLQALVKFLVYNKVTRSSVEVIQNSRHLIKRWPLVYDSPFDVRCFAHLLTSSSLVSNSPGDLIVLPYTCTYNDLKGAAEDTFRDTYCVMKNLTVDSIDEFESCSDGEKVFLMKLGAHVWVRGNGLDMPLKYEGGNEVEQVQCPCGAGTFNGERNVKLCTV